MLLDDFILTKKTFALQAAALDWKAAIKLGTDLLEQAGCITREYYEDIIRQTETIGPYFLVAPGLALPHTDPKKGVKKTGWALITLKHPVRFGDEANDPIDILITLASVSSKEHTTQGILQVVEIFDSPQMVDAIRCARIFSDLERVFSHNKQKLN